MPRFEQAKTSRNALLAFGRRVTPEDAFDDLVAARGWQKERWMPTFVDLADRPIQSTWAPQPGPMRESAETKRHVLRRPEVAIEDHKDPGSAESRLLVAPVDDLPSLYFVEWLYIDFVLSCVGKVSEAARVLGIRRSTLQRKRKKNPPTK